MMIMSSICVPLQSDVKSSHDELSVFFVTFSSLKVALPAPPPAVIEPMLMLFSAPISKLRISKAPSLDIALSWVSPVSFLLPGK